MGVSVLLGVLDDAAGGHLFAAAANDALVSGLALTVTHGSINSHVELAANLLYRQVSVTMNQTENLWKGWITSSSVKPAHDSFQLASSCGSSVGATASTVHGGRHGGGGSGSSCC